MKCHFIFIIISLLTISLCHIDKGSEFLDYCQIHGKAIAPTYQKSNCVHFMDKVLQGFLNINNPELSNIIYVKYTIPEIEKALKSNDTAVVGGVAYGLVKFGYAGYVKLKDIKKGDIVQYWSTDGYTNGHCGIFTEYDKSGNMMLIGSHQDSKGYGVMNTYSKNFKMYFYICRLK
jgi:hypothetical protein